MCFKIFSEVYAFFTNIPTPQKIPMLNALNDLLNGNLVVFFFEKEVEKRKGWASSLKEARFTYEFLESRKLDINHPMDPGYTFLPSSIPSLREFEKIVVSGGISPLEIAIALKAMWQKIPYVVWTGAVSLRGGYALMIPVRYVLRRFIYSRAHAIVVPNSLARKHAIRMGGKRVEIAYTSFDLGRFEYEKKHEGEFLRILHLGRLIRRKRIGDMLKALSTMDEYTLDIIGEGPSKEEVKDMIRKLNLQSKVKLLPPVPHERVHEVYRNYDLFILPSENEVHGFVVMEALMSSVPVIVTDEVGAKDFVIPRAIYPVGNVEELRKRIEWMRHPEHREMAVRFGKKLIKEKATPTEWARVFRRVLLE